MSGDALLCTVTDHGPGIHDPLLGHTPQRHADPSGPMGLWLARRLCEHLDYHLDHDTFTVRLRTTLKHP